MRRVRRKLRYFDFGDELADQVALNGIVIDKNDTIEADVECRSDMTQVLVFVLPVGYPKSAMSSSFRTISGWS